MGLMSLFLAVSGVAVALSSGEVKGGGSTPDSAVHLDVKSGGRTGVNDVKTNKLIQTMGRYCVLEYNKGLRRGLKTKNLNVEGGIELLSFKEVVKAEKEVVKAEKQVVAGTKYFLHIAATTHHGTLKNYDAELLVKPNPRLKEMLVFAPDPHPHNH